MPATTEHTTIAHRLFNEIFSQGKLEVADAIYAPSYISHDPAHPGIHGTSSIKQFVMMSRIAFPDMHFTLEDIRSDKDLVIVYWTIHSTHLGTLINIPPTGRKIEMNGVSTLRIVNGQIHEEWANWDLFSLMQQVAIAPSMD